MAQLKSLSDIVEEAEVTKNTTVLLQVQDQMHQVIEFTRSRLHIPENKKNLNQAENNLRFINKSIDRIMGNKTNK